MSLRETIMRQLIKVEKPGRYAGGERNSVVKDTPVARMALSYPDLYEVGMANSGLRILYERANSVEGVACERVFAVAPDFEDFLRQQGLPLYTLETFTPLDELDCIGFNLAHELLFTTMLQVLDLGGVPLYRRDRGEKSPIVIAAGEAVSNPLPVADFVDMVFLGDGEDAVVEIARVLKDISGREARMDAMAAIEGMMDLRNYTVAHHRLQGPVVSLRRYSSSTPPDPEKPLVPSLRITQEKVVVELDRGCTNLCKFCHAGYYTLPLRRYNPEEVARRAFHGLKATGFDELTLISLTVSDNPHLVSVLNHILPELTEAGVSVSLPSLKVDRATLPVIEAISDVRQTSLTFAVESASQWQRGLIHKKVRDEDMYEIVRTVYEKGWRLIKLYFMIGLPGSREVDEAAETIAFVKRLLDSAGPRLDVNVTLSPFVPKPHTPFQWEEQRDAEYIRATVLAIKQGLPRRVKISSHDPEASLLEGLMARGDTALSGVIEEAYRRGARFESWREYFRRDIWQDVLAEMLPGWKETLGVRPHDADLPWSIVRTGAEKAVDRMKDINRDLSSYQPPANRFTEAPNRDALKGAFARFQEKYEVRQRVRLRFTRQGRARFISHIDFVEVIKRALRSVGVPMAFSQGFNKRERIAAGYPVPVGIESRVELFDCECYGAVSENHFSDIDMYLPEGVRFISWREIEKGPALMSSISAVRYQVYGDEKVLRDFAFSMEEKPVFTRKNKKGKLLQIPFDEAVLQYESFPVYYELLLPQGSSSSVRIDHIITHCVGEDDIYLQAVKIAQYTESGDGYCEL